MAVANGMQQGITITGTVTDETGAPMPGVNVVLKGTTTGVITGENGKYIITAPDKSTYIVFSFIGYISNEILVGDQTVIDLMMKEDTQEIEEVVVIGYGTARKKDLTGSLTHVDTKALDAQPAGNFVEFLRGRVAGFNSTISSKAKDDFGGLEVRGQKSINASNTPLIVLDGMIYYGDIADINPRDIESIDVLKDASSAAIYGAKAASGVVLVTTKKGTESKPTVNFSGSVGWAQPANVTKARSPEDYLTEKMWYQKTNSTGKPAGYYDNPNNLPEGVSIEQWRSMSQQDPSLSDDYIWGVRLGLQPTELKNYSAGKTIDWYDETFKTGFRQDYTLSVSGRNERTQYYTSVGFVQNEGIIFGDKYQNVRIRMNLENKVTNWFKFGMNTQFANRNEQWQAVGWERYWYQSPFGELYQPDGSYTWSTYEDSEGANYFRNQEYDYKKMRRTLNANLYAIVTLPYGLSYQVTYSNRFGFHQDYSFIPSSTGVTGSDKGDASRADYTRWDYTIDNMLKWFKNFDMHRFDVTLLYSAEKFQDWNTTAKNKDFSPNENLSYHGMNFGSKPITESNDRYRTGDALMARLNYSLLDRYFLNASVRRDGYSEFGEDNPYAWFYSAGLGWLITSEPFFPQNDYLNMLKLRASFGTNGNRDFGDNYYAALATYKSLKYLYGNTATTGIIPEKMGNSQLQWEKTAAYNLAVDFGMFNNRLTGTVDAYIMKTTDLLMKRTLTKMHGYPEVWTNIGEVQNKGLEVTLAGSAFEKENFSWNTNLMFYFNRNEIKHLYGDMEDVKDAQGNVIGQREADDKASGRYIGHAIDAIYDYKVLGVWQLGQETEAAKYGKKPGDFRLQDVNEDGKMLPDDDKQFQGYKTPRYRLSWGNVFTFYKDFELSFMLNGQFGHKDENKWHKHNEFTEGRTNHLDYDYWTPENPTNKWGRLGSTTTPDFYYWVNRSFVRMESVTLSYNLPQRILSPVGINSLKVYFNINNAFCITQWDYFDVETKVPTPRVFTLGLNLSL